MKVLQFLQVMAKTVTSTDHRAELRFAQERAKAEAALAQPQDDLEASLSEEPRALSLEANESLSDREDPSEPKAMGPSFAIFSLESYLMELLDESAQADSSDQGDLVNQADQGAGELPPFPGEDPALHLARTARLDQVSLLPQKILHLRASLEGKVLQAWSESAQGENLQNDLIEAVLACEEAIGAWLGELFQSRCHDVILTLSSPLLPPLVRIYEPWLREHFAKTPPCLIRNLLLKGQAALEASQGNAWLLPRNLDKAIEPMDAKHLKLFWKAFGPPGSPKLTYVGSKLPAKTAEPAPYFDHLRELQLSIASPAQGTKHGPLSTSYPIPPPASYEGQMDGMDGGPQDPWPDYTLEVPDMTDETEFLDLPEGSQDWEVSTGSDALEGAGGTKEPGGPGGSGGTGAAGGSGAPGGAEKAAQSSRSRTAKVDPQYFPGDLLWKAQKSSSSKDYEQMIRSKTLADFVDRDQWKDAVLFVGKAILDAKNGIKTFQNGERCLIKFLITKGNRGIYGKIWAQAEDQPVIIRALKGDRLLFAGLASYDDKFDHANTVTVERIYALPSLSLQDLRAIALGEKDLPEGFTWGGADDVPDVYRRLDRAPKKRVECNAMSKFSAREGLIPSPDLVKRAYAWGHPAVVLCDRGVVQGYPQAWDTYQSLKREDPSTPFHLIYGLNARIVDDGYKAAFYPEGLDALGGFAGQGHLAHEGALPPIPAEAPPSDYDFTKGFVAFDLETTGLNPAEDRVIEVGAIRYLPDPKRPGVFYEDAYFQTLVNPQMALSDEVSAITHIHTFDLLGAPLMEEVLAPFQEFVGDLCLVGHNVFFDQAFMRYESYRVRVKGAPRKFNHPIVDTLLIAKRKLDIPSYQLNKVATKLNVPFRQEDLHRAVDDAKLCAEVFMVFLRQSEVKTFSELNADLQGIRANLPEDRASEEKRTDQEGPEGKVDEAGQVEQNGHEEKPPIEAKAPAKVLEVTLLVHDEVGLYHLYRLVSLSHLQYLKEEPQIPKSLLHYFKDGLVVGSGGKHSELFALASDIFSKANKDMDRSITNLNYLDRKTRDLIRFYDYTEVHSFNNLRTLWTSADEQIQSEEDFRQVNRLLIALARKFKLQACAVSVAKTLEKEDDILMKILKKDNKESDYENTLPQYFLNTQEMLEEFSYLNPEDQEKVVIEDPQALAKRFTRAFPPFPAGTYPPSIEDSDHVIRESCEKKALETYSMDGKTLPEVVQARMDQELASIIDNGYAVLYFIAQALVEQANTDGWSVGSRGSVGSSVAAWLSDISEVNPLPPHYVCPKCHYSEFFTNEEVGSGFDLPDKVCPQCGTPLHKDGQNIPFETFLGFEGDKQPDIDLNFAGTYQERAHAKIGEMFGSSFTFRAGTISSYADKNALKAVRDFYATRDTRLSVADMEAVAQRIMDVKVSTGQHPGGIVIIPHEWEVYDFCPVQMPSNDPSKGVITTHLDFNALKETILKLDILGHDDPEMLKDCAQLTGVTMDDFPMVTREGMDLFLSMEGLKIKDQEYLEKIKNSALIGLPEVGTPLGRDMVAQTQPTTFADLMQLSGLAHGTGVWQDNAQTLIQDGTCTIKNVIGCRDGIMLTLIQYGMEKKMSFDIMEKVRKGKGLKAEYEEAMVDHKVPDWYIKSCKKIQYMFPKAHAAAYMISTLRIAYYKVHYPVAYYCSYFTVRAKFFSDEAFFHKTNAELYQDLLDLRARMAQGERLENKEKYRYVVSEVVCEMAARGIHFAPMSLNRSAATAFLPDALVDDQGHLVDLFAEDKQGLQEGTGSEEDGSEGIEPEKTGAEGAGDRHSLAILPPFSSLDGVSDNEGLAIVKAREEAPFDNVEDFINRTKVGKNALAALRKERIFEGMNETYQLTFTNLFKDL